MIETATFVCSICNEPSLSICVCCTKDACPNHRCARCKACSDCCECEVPLTEPEPQMTDRVQLAETPPILTEVILTEVDSTEMDTFLLPPEASEEPDLNVPPVVAEIHPEAPHDVPANAAGQPPAPLAGAVALPPEDHSKF